MPSNKVVQGNSLNEDHFSFEEMAKYGGDGSWWGWIQNAKDKVVAQSTEVLEFVKNDVEEFTKVVSEETSAIVSATAGQLKTQLRLDDDDSTANTVKKSVSGFLNHVSEVFTPPPEDEDQEAIVIVNQQPVILNRLQAAIYAVSQDVETFLTDPEGEEAQYEEWLKTFDLENRQSELSDLLVNNQPLRHHYTSLVPAQVSHVVFWHRYFYKVQRLEAADSRRQEIKQRAEKPNTDSDLVWDEDEDFGGNQDIPEEVQTKLLEEYEQEVKQRDSDEEQEKNKGTDNKTITENTKDKPTLPPSKEMMELEVDVSKSAETTEKPSPSSTESNESDEWEKVDSCDATSPPADKTDAKDKQDKTEDKADNSKSDDWESWE